MTRPKKHIVEDPLEEIPTYPNSLHQPLSVINAFRGLNSIKSESH